MKISIALEIRMDNLWGEIHFAKLVGIILKKIARSVRTNKYCKIKIKTSIKILKHRQTHLL